MKLKCNLLELPMKYVGTRYLPQIEVLAPCIETAFSKLDDDLQNEPEKNPLIEFRFSGFQLAEPNSALLDVFESQGKGRFAVTSGGYLVLNKELVEGDPKERLTPEEYYQLGAFLGLLFRDAYKFKGPLIFTWPKEGEMEIEHSETAVALYCSISTPCSEEVWRQYQELHSQELKAILLNSSKNGVGFESSKGQTLQ